MQDLYGSRWRFPGRGAHFRVSPDQSLLPRRPLGAARVEHETGLTSDQFNVIMHDMKKKLASRQYRMGARAEAALRTEQSILSAMAELWREQSLDAITLEDVAARAGVSVRTVMRRFGSRDGLIAATMEQEGSRIISERDRARTGDVEGALAVLLRHYERDGVAVLRTLSLEDRHEAARQIVARGRSEHRAWCARVFSPFLPVRGTDAYRTRLDAFVAATDLYLWKLLRLDLGRTADETRLAFHTLLDGLTLHFSPRT
jgi:AcrR family transcriptional regulator